MARPTKKPAANKARPKAAPARPKAAPKAARPAPKKAAKQVKKAVRAATVAKLKPAKKPAAKPAPKPAPKAAAKTKAAPKAVAAPKAGPAPVVKPAPPKATPAPKAVAAKPVIAKPEPPKKPRKPELTPKEIAGIRASLMEQKAIFVREFADMEDSTSISQSELSGEVSFDEEYADAGSFTFEREKELSIGNNIRDLLDKVNHALSAIDRGTYGICENCGNPIAKARLQALPYSTLCLNCKQIDERTR